ncbi:MAG: hypothetical protein ISS72_04215 [Candidatus Brocadiae bacterium]|nr:hypothetical protein [Candidatus Brocadiia bacterium]
MRHTQLWVASVVILWAIGAVSSVRAANYETCFAFDPVFIQADQRHTAPAAKAPPTRRAEAPPVRPPSLRSSLAKLRAALKAISAPAGHPSAGNSGRKTP